MKKYFVIILLLVLYSCASQGYPSGGPIDEKGPQIIDFKPDLEIIPKNQTITIFFDEMINFRRFVFLLCEAD